MSPSSQTPSASATPPGSPWPPVPAPPRDSGAAGGSQLPSNNIEREERDKKEESLVAQKRKQGGIGFPSAGKQRHLLVIRMNIARSNAVGPDDVKAGLNRLCSLFADIDSGKTKIDQINDQTGKLDRPKVSDFMFSFTLGFGRGFFDLLKVSDDRRPRRIKEMPDHVGLGDVTPYSLGQTDLIIQLGSDDDFVNRWVLENTLEPETPADQASGRSGQAVDPIPRDIVRAVEGWATITDVHAGFQRVDGRNLQGFNDGVSNPNRLSPLFDSLVWTTDKDEPNTINQDGTYMVFQKIVHDLDQWRELEVDEQNEWVGRSKGTGLLLGTLDDKDDEKLAEDLKSEDGTVRQAALAKWELLFSAQSDPTVNFFQGSNGDPRWKNVADRCPVWSHVRKANPRTADGVPPILIFRRGYPFMESGIDHKTRSGLLFVSFERDIENGFEFIKKNWFGNGGFPVPVVRQQFGPAELKARHKGGRFSEQELLGIQGNAQVRAFLGLADDTDFADALQAAREPLTQQTGREGLAGPSELGVVPTGEFLAIVPIGGGYYFVPPIPDKDVSKIGQAYLA